MTDELPKQNCLLRTEAGGRGGENAENRNSCFFAEMGCLLPASPLVSAFTPGWQKHGYKAK
jgi:hypothetical protein